MDPQSGIAVLEECRRIGAALVAFGPWREECCQVRFAALQTG
jgi:hypothetical protein